MVINRYKICMLVQSDVMRQKAGLTDWWWVLPACKAGADLSAWQLQCRQACRLLCSQRETQRVTFHFVEPPYLCLCVLCDKWQLIKAVGNQRALKWWPKECGLMVEYLVNVGKSEWACPNVCVCACVSTCISHVTYYLFISIKLCWLCNLPWNRWCTVIISFPTSDAQTR